MDELKELREAYEKVRNCTNQHELLIRAKEIKVLLDMAETLLAAQGSAVLPKKRNNGKFDTCGCYTEGGCGCSIDDFNEAIDETAINLVAMVKGLEGEIRKEIPSEWNDSVGNSKDKVGKTITALIKRKLGIDL